MVSLVGLFLRGFFDDTKTESEETGKLLLSDFIEAVGSIVEAKINRFRAKLKDLKPASNKFNHITHPEEQLGAICTAAVHFLCKAYDLNDDQVNITILRRRANVATWNFDFKYQDWNHADNVAFPPGSAGAHCAETGEPVFFPDKIAGAKSGKYLLSARDKRRGPGSAFVFPISFTTQMGNFYYVVSIITYGKQFCDAWDKDSSAVTQSFLREICRRIEVELCLKTVKTL